MADFYEIKRGRNVNNLTCPYCGREQLTAEPDEFTANCCFAVCEHCEKEFWYSVRVVREYDSWEGDND
jgi:transcription elongation factor Elf1